MRNPLLALNLFWGLISLIISGGGVAQQQRLFESGEFCHAVVVGPKSIRLPQHCLSPDSKSIHLEGIGSLDIKKIESSAFYNNSPIDTIIVVHLKKEVLAGMEPSGFSEPQVGHASGLKDGSQPCQITRISPASSLIYHSCFGSKGDSGRIIYQRGRPVGIHLGRYAGSPIAASGNGSSLDFGMGFDSIQYEPQGFKIKVSCCEKAEKAIKKAGDGIVNTLEHWKGEIKRVAAEIEKLPKVLSTDYLQEKTAAIRIPQVPKINLDLSGLKKELTWKDLLIVAGTSGVGLVVLAAYNFDEDRLGQDVKRELENGWELLIDALTPPGPPKNCESVHKDDMQECAADLKKEIETYKSKMKAKRGQLKSHIDSRIRRLQEQL
ncbi:MAG TPA: hypothetical protein VE954_08940 [Oligoflexus sp.]|uniref:hypothetical protein n=1 Tax=Oligoflexus sp. TaxID=1971216 RepID=UPI002D6A4782|nr:hypothetical protein [Oligoflexus sp.]HYX33228.1 hypothetical protein [Oligoflexus sp.]